MIGARMISEWRSKWPSTLLVDYIPHVQPYHTYARQSIKTSLFGNAANKTPTGDKIQNKRFNFKTQATKRRCVEGILACKGKKTERQESDYVNANEHYECRAYKARGRNIDDIQLA